MVSYIADHYAVDLPLGRLANIACMSESKLKSCFKRQFGCSVTQYIQGRRMSQAEHLLIGTDFTMGQIAQMIGYTTSSRFVELFKKSTSMLKPASSLCNHRCKYCFYCDVAEQREIRSFGKMTDLTRERILNRLAESLEPGDQLELAF